MESRRVEFELSLFLACGFPSLARCSVSGTKQHSLCLIPETVFLDRLRDILAQALHTSHSITHQRISISGFSRRMCVHLGNLPYLSEAEIRGAESQDKVPLTSRSAGGFGAIPLLRCRK